MVQQRYMVSADHIVPKYRLRNAEITVTYKDYRQFGGQEEFYWFHSLFGSSKSYATAEAAIYGMLQDHGCTNIVIVRN